MKDELDLEMTDEQINAIKVAREIMTRKSRRKRLKWIGAHTEDELNAAVEKAAAMLPNFYVLLHGIDAYMERRRRRVAEHKSKVRAAIDRECMEELADPWGDS